MLEYVMDTETTGFDPKVDRIVEIGVVEVDDLLPTGRMFHAYINPGCGMPDGAFRVHGLSERFLLDFPPFADLAPGFLEFIGGGRLVAHNAPFDVGFVNAELQRIGLPPLDNAVTDTVALARQKLPGATASLDALCKRFKIDNSHRTFHGALLDSEILADVYLSLQGGRQRGLALDGVADGAGDGGAGGRGKNGLMPDQGAHAHRPYRQFSLSPDEAAAHAAFLDASVKNPLWRESAPPPRSSSPEP